MTPEETALALKAKWYGVSVEYITPLLDQDDKDMIGDVAAAIREAVADEREECAQEAESAMSNVGTDDPHEALDMAAAHIRARA